MKKEKDAFFSVRIESLFLDSPLEYDVYLKIDHKFVMFRKKGDVITTERMKGLLEHHVREVFIPQEQKNAFLEFMRITRQNQSLATEVRTKFIKESAFMHFHELYTKPDISSIVEDSKTLIKEIVEVVSADLEAAASLMKLSTHDYYTYNHSVNVSVYCIAIAKKVIGEKEKDLITIGLGGFFHDLGKRKIDETIITKPGRLNNEEWTKMKKHPEYGAELLSNIQGINEDVKRVVFEHHENVDGSGYPKGLSGDNISKFGRIAAIADVFDALTSDRPYKKAVSAQEALQIMYSMQPGKFDESIFSNFGIKEKIVRSPKSSLKEFQQLAVGKEK